MLDRRKAGADFVLASLNQVAAWILFTAISLAPLPFGSVAPTATAFWCIFLGIGLLIASLAGPTPAAISPFALAAMAIFTYAIVLHEQSSVHPWFTSEHPAQLWQETGNLLNIPIAPSASVARNQPFYSLGAPLCNLLAAFCAFIVCSDRGRARQFFQIVAWAGVLYAAFGVLALLVDPTRTLWREKTAYQGFLTSTFVNRNTAAVYFGCCGIIWLLFFLENFRDFVGRYRYSRPADISRHLSKNFPCALWLPLAMLFICLTAMFLTGSRAGTVSSLIGALLALTIFCSREMSQKRNTIIAVAAAGTAALVLLQVLGAGVSGRFEIEGLFDAARLDTFKSTWRIVCDHPWLGTGIGTFPWSFPPYRAPESSMWGTWDRAHNTVLEIASEFGLPFAAAIVALWTAALLKLIHGTRIRKRDEIFPIGALAIALVAITHSMVDFSLQIPAFSMTVFAVVGTGIGQSFSTRSSRHS